ncbi:uncharacterized protein EV154DRAFT_506093 [Mucor mucedo]|uniref:uncharacterized protein n=1 Tax=Mucor mucedo TaxID=29922 RepID=UPI00221EDE72|nr:uncharacterized protein EV154DRAFT_506093 [Mucor mucedo]KAI7892029.1 hypothetical protein EV154DRAFT_506093 [Mucor mucedo]
MSDAGGYLSDGEGAGLKSIAEFNRFLANAEPQFTLDRLNKLINTTNQDLLIHIGKSRFVAKRLQKTIVRCKDPWQPEIIKRILMVLNYIPFELSNLIENELGHAVKDIKKTAMTFNDEQLVHETTNLIKTWKDMQSKQLGGKRDSPERSSSDSPPATEQKKIRLAIQKDPPAARPKAMTDPNFFTSSLASDVKYRTVRPVYSVGPNKEETVAATTSTSTAAAAATTTTTKRPAKKSVTFAENLFEIREYEKNPEEWTSFDTAPKEEPYYNIPTVTWYQPLELSFNTDENPNLVIHKQVRTPETASQDSREKVALAAIYTSAQHIPSSPGEPDEVPDPNNDTKLIPLVDVNQHVHHNTIHPDMMTPENLNAAAAIAAAMKDPLPQQYQSPPPPPPPMNPVQRVATNTSLPEISSHTVEAMLKNNPGIMQSLKQLSFLAAGNTTSMPTPTYQPNTYQPIHQPQNYSNEGYARETHHKNRPSSQKNRGRGAQGRGRGGGNSTHRAGGGGGGGGPMRVGARTCNYYASPEGCRNGTNCPFSHDN